MVTVFSLFRICNVLYQVMATFVVYWINLCSTSMPAFIREWIWILFLAIIFFCNLKHFKSYWQKRKQSRISFIILIIVAVLLSMLVPNSSINNMFIGIKYWFWRMFILLSAWFFWYVYSDQIKTINLKKLPWILVLVVMLGFLFQWAKLLRPNAFYSIWYWGLDDYAYWDNPPIYYLTWFQWVLRRQGFFSWPNNYWYFLIAFLPIIRTYFTNNIKEKRYSKFINMIALWVRFAAMILTLSRAVLVWWVVVFCMLYRKK